jgi:hypothetical protein
MRDNLSPWLRSARHLGLAAYADQHEAKPGEQFPGMILDLCHYSPSCRATGGGRCVFLQQRLWGVQ